MNNIARFILFDILKNKIVILYTILLFIISWSVLGLETNYTKATLSLLNVVLLVVPGDGTPVAVLVTIAVFIVGLIVNALLAFRRVRAIGYILRDDDLLFRRGIMFERVVAVPYGRLQLVDVTRGPLLRALGLATLKFVTASAATGVSLPGLKVEDAEQLRDRLVQLAESRRSGL